MKITAVHVDTLELALAEPFVIAAVGAGLWSVRSGACGDR